MDQDELDVEINRVSRDILIQIKKGSYDFSRANAIVRTVEEEEEDKSATREGDVEASSEEKKVAPEVAELGGATCCKVSDSDGDHVGKDRVKRKFDVRGKIYLAPLTTVGNLPYRRVCKGFGVDITCSEMALSHNLLQGHFSEWALLRRHPCEDIFGVQLAGAKVEAMTRAAQVVEETCNVDFIDINMGCPIDSVCNIGAGAALANRKNRAKKVVQSMTQVLRSLPLTVKMRMGFETGKRTAHKLIPDLSAFGISAVTMHGRSREQRYSKEAEWTYINECAEIAEAHGVPLIGNGDIFSYDNVDAALRGDYSVSGVMLARGALVKPWLPTEIRERRHWDISASERMDILRNFVRYGLEHWGSDDTGVSTTRRFLLEWLSFLHRYIPVGLLERLPQKMQERPPPFFGRNDLETLFASTDSNDWVKITEMLLGPVPDGFFFTPKHKANAYSPKQTEWEG